MEYTQKQLADTEAYLLKATPGEVGLQVLQLPAQLLTGEEPAHPIDVVNGSVDTRTDALALVVSVLDTVLAYAEEGGLEPADVGRLLSSVMQDRDSEWAAPVTTRALFDRDEAIFEELTMTSEGRRALESVEAGLIEDGVIPGPYDEDDE